MGDQNQAIYLRRFVQGSCERVLEVGSKDYGSTVPFRYLIPHNAYIGLDLAPGPGVDLVGDLARDLCDLEEGSFSLVICCSVLEHVSRPWLMARNIMRLLKPGGRMYIAVPWVWRFHAYPDDYFRFSWRGVEALFEGVEWEQRHYSTNVPGEFFEIDDALSDFENRLALLVPAGQSQRKYLPYLQVHMLGHKPMTTHAASGL